MRSQTSSACAAGRPNGTVRSLRPLPKTRTTCRSPVDVVDVEPDQLADPDAGGVEQLEHGHVAQPDRAAVVGELGRRLDQVARLVRAQHRRQRLVRLRRAQAARRRRLGARPVRASQAVNTRTAVARRASVVRDLPVVCCWASQLRSVRRSSVATSVMPEPARVLEQAGDVAEVGAHGVRGEVALGGPGGARTSPSTRAIASGSASACSSCVGSAMARSLGRRTAATRGSRARRLGEPPAATPSAPPGRARPAGSARDRTSISPMPAVRGDRVGGDGVGQGHGVEHLPLTLGQPVAGGVAAARAARGGGARPGRPPRAPPPPT